MISSQSISSHSLNFYKDLISSFWVFLLTHKNRQKDTGENITSLAEVTTDGQIQILKANAGSFLGTVRQYYWSAQALEEKTRPAETDLVTNYWERSTATQSGSGDSSTACAEQNT